MVCNGHVMVIRNDMFVCDSVAKYCDSVVVDCDSVTIVCDNYVMFFNNGARLSATGNDMACDNGAIVG